MAQVTNSTNIDNSSLPSSSKVENEGANSNGKLSASEFNNLIQIVSSLVSGHNLQVSELSELRSGKQDKLVSGTNIKTINGQSVLGSGNISVQSGSSSASGISINTISGLTASNVQTALEQIYAKAKESGLTDSQIASAIATYLTNHPIEGVTEAPKDGKQYARKDGAWSEVQSVGLGIKVQSDWNETSTTSKAYIKNKPSLFDGNYNSLTNKPTLFDGNYNSLTNKPTLFDGDYESLTNKPEITQGMTDEERAQLQENTDNIATNSSLIAALQESGLPTGGEYAFSFLEETAMNGLTEDNTVGMVLYFGLEEDASASPATYDSTSGKLTIPDGTYDSTTGKITLASATYDNTTGQLKFN